MLEVVVLGSGSAGNAALVRSGNTCVLVDAGLSAKKIISRLAVLGVSPQDLDGILLTHEHGDHAGGLKVLLNQHSLPLYCNPLTADSLRRGSLASHANWKLFSSGSEFQLGEFTVRSFSVPHDAADPVGFVISRNGAQFGVLTDLGYATQMVLEALKNVGALLIETNHDEELLQRDTKRPWAVKQRILSRHGHLSNAAAAEVVAQVATGPLQRVLLGHLSRDCNSPDLACGAISDRLHAAGRGDIVIHCAEQDVSSPIFAII